MPRQNLLSRAQMFMAGHRSFSRCMEQTSCNFALLCGFSPDAHVHTGIETSFVVMDPSTSLSYLELMRLKCRCFDRSRLVVFLACLTGANPFLLSLRCYNSSLVGSMQRQQRPALPTGREVTRVRTSGSVVLKLNVVPRPRL
eukprot:768050-Hanusia_phi.AAC.5